jgi:hypothetical protein
MPTTETLVVFGSQGLFDFSATGWRIHVRVIVDAGEPPKIPPLAIPQKAHLAAQSPGGIGEQGQEMETALRALYAGLVTEPTQPSPPRPNRGGDRNASKTPSMAALLFPGAVTDNGNSYSVPSCAFSNTAQRRCDARLHS